MLTVRIPSSYLYECSTYLAHNGQYEGVEYYLIREEGGAYQFSFRDKQSYLAFCYYWSKIIL